MSVAETGTGLIELGVGLGIVKAVSSSASSRRAGKRKVKKTRRGRLNR